jgi:hypothetical protein
MASGGNLREIQPVILTDRVAVPDGIHLREWALHDTLHTAAFPLGYKRSVRPVIVVTNSVDHLSPLVAVAIALANKAGVDDSDWDLGADPYRTQRAVRADTLITQAKQELVDARSDNAIDPLVFSKMMGLLRTGELERVQFSKHWEYAAPLYSTMTVQELRLYEDEMLGAMFGNSARSPDSVRKDHDRARKFMHAVLDGNYSVLDQAPQQNAVELTEKYLSAINPHLLPSSRTTPMIKLDGFSHVTQRGGRVTQSSKECGYEKKQRSVGASSIAALPTGFFTGT